MCESVTRRAQACRAESATVGAVCLVYRQEDPRLTATLNEAVVVRRGRRLSSLDR